MRNRLKRLAQNIKWLNRIPFIRLQEAGTPFCHPYPSLAEAGVLREDFILRRCQGKSVIHFGFLDAPFMASKAARGELLHMRIKAVANVVYGFDVDGPSLADYRHLTGDQANALWDVQTPLPLAARQALDAAAPQGFDLVIFSEVLEHLLNPGLAVSNLAQLCRRYRCRLLVTVPNAFSVVSFYNALNHIEAVHPDHYHYYSPYTLQKMLIDCGFEEVELWLYGSQDTLLAPGLTKNGVIAMAAAAQAEAQ